MCSKDPTYCSSNLCCCTSNNCFSQLRLHFLQSPLHNRNCTQRIFVTCDVYRQKWMGNARSKVLNKSSYPTAQEKYRRTDCAACVSRVDEEGVEMTCSNANVACHGMDRHVDGSLKCNENDDCCCQGQNCPKALRDFYSGNRNFRIQALEASKTARKLSDRQRSSFSVLIIAISLFIVVRIELSLLILLG
uniref:Disintegrin domain-containing protein n=1 Tax=Elaeophora elaphi TaxID=1147741 RepID=A0A0R3S6E6_9BILA